LPILEDVKEMEASFTEVVAEIKDRQGNPEKYPDDAEAFQAMCAGVVIEAVKKVVEAPKEEKKAEEKKSSATPTDAQGWTEEEVTNLIKVVAKFPPGTA
jgi:hypothetical protein